MSGREDRFRQEIDEAGEWACFILQSPTLHFKTNEKDVSIKRES
jgi:hypothetical protein